MKKVSLLLIPFFILSCTDNTRTRRFGGKEERTINTHEVLVNMTWKDNDLWVLTRDTTTGVFHFRESSSFGIWEGEINVTPLK